MDHISSAVELVFPPCGYVFDTHTPIQNEFIEKIEKENIDDAVEWLKTVKDREMTYPEPLKFVWKGEGAAVFELAENAEFTDAYSVRCDAPFCEVDNLKIGTKYYWRVNGGEARSFYTKDNGIRFIRIDGALNVRDIGGKGIKQGLIYRGSDLDDVYRISEEGMQTFCDQLGIKTEIDLRKEVDADRPCVLGPRVLLKSLPYRPYLESFEEEHRRGICRIMEFLSDEKNYPIYLHCLGGADRTGMVVLYLRALAGEDADFIHMDYELTSLSTYALGLGEGVPETGIRKRTIQRYIDFLDTLATYAPGAPISEQVHAFLLDCGVKEECIDKVLSILVEKKA